MRDTRKLAKRIVDTLMCDVKDGQVRILDAGDAQRFYWRPEEIVDLIVKELERDVQGER